MQALSMVITGRLGRHYEDAALCSKNHIQNCQQQTQNNNIQNYSTIQINFLFWVEYNSTHCLPPPEAFILIGYQLEKIN